jgi:hypothetical protein
MVTRDAVLASDWYHARLAAKQARDVALRTRHVAATGSALARERLAWVSSPKYLQSLHGTIGADPMESSAFAKATADKGRPATHRV